MKLFDIPSGKVMKLEAYDKERPEASVHPEHRQHGTASDYR